jgi:hypothetical protein
VDLEFIVQQDLLTIQHLVLLVTLVKLFLVLFNALRVTMLSLDNSFLNVTPVLQTHLVSFLVQHLAQSVQLVHFLLGQPQALLLVWL